MDAGAHHYAARRRCAQRGGDERAHRGEDDRRVERLGARRQRVARPLRAEPLRERLRCLVLRAREREHAPALVHGDLADDVRGRPEAIEAEALAVAGQPQRAVADQPAAQQRRDLRSG